MEKPLLLQMQMRRCVVDDHYDFQIIPWQYTSGDLQDGKQDNKGEQGG